MGDLREMGTGTSGVRNYEPLRTAEAQLWLRSESVLLQLPRAAIRIVVARDFTTFDAKLDTLLDWKRALSTDMLNCASDSSVADFWGPPIARWQQGI